MATKKEGTTDKDYRRLFLDNKPSKSKVLRALGTERRRGMQGHWAYDKAKHHEMYRWFKKNRKSLNEEQMKESHIKVGDHIWAPLKPGWTGTGYGGKVTKIEGDTVHFEKSEPGQKFGPRTFKTSLQHAKKVSALDEAVSNIVDAAKERAKQRLQAAKINADTDRQVKSISKSK